MYFKVPAEQAPIHVPLLHEATALLWSELGLASCSWPAQCKVSQCHRQWIRYGNIIHRQH